MCPLVRRMTDGIGDLDFPRIISMPARIVGAVYIVCGHQLEKNMCAAPAAGLAIVQVNLPPVIPITNV